jgi:hypothetical protein
MLLKVEAAVKHEKRVARLIRSVVRVVETREWFTRRGA